MKNAIVLTALITALSVVAVPALAGDHEKKRRHDSQQDRHQGQNRHHDRHQDRYQDRKHHNDSGYHRSFCRHFGQSYRRDSSYKHGYRNHHRYNHYYNRGYGHRYGHRYGHPRRGYHGNHLYSQCNSYHSRNDFLKIVGGTLLLGELLYHGHK